MRMTSGSLKKSRDQRMKSIIDLSCTRKCSFLCNLAHRVILNEGVLDKNDTNNGSSGNGERNKDPGMFDRQPSQAVDTLSRKRLASKRKFVEKTSKNVKSSKQQKTLLRSAKALHEDDASLPIDCDVFDELFWNGKSKHKTATKMNVPK